MKLFDEVYFLVSVVLSLPYRAPEPAAEFASRCDPTGAASVLGQDVPDVEGEVVEQLD